MQSSFIHTKSPGLADTSTKKNVISTEDHKVRIVGRHPANGKPAPGTSFSIDVEVQTNINEHGVLFRMPFWCPDATIVIRGAYSDKGKVWGQKFVTTRFVNNCTGRENIRFDPSFTPDENHWVRIEVYSGGVNQQEINNQEPAAVSPPMNFAASLEAGRGSGQYDVPYDALTQITQNAGFQDLSGLLGKVALIGGGIAGLYLLAPALPSIKNRISKAVKE